MIDALKKEIENNNTKGRKRKRVVIMGLYNSSWVCIPHVVDHRYVLAKCGTRMLVCVGVNPSTAIPKKLDKTVKRVDRTAQFCRYDGWVMLNLYPQKSTDPNMLHQEANTYWETLNRRIFERVIRKLAARQRIVDIWAAWGDLIEERTYLKRSACALFSLCSKYNVTWKQAGELTEKGNPRHPSRLKIGTALTTFNVSTYEAKMKKM